MSAKKGKPNWILGILFCISLGIHIVLIGNLHGLLSATKNVPRIELTIKDLPNPNKRSIPRPRNRIKPPEERKILPRRSMNSVVDQVDYHYPPRAEKSDLSAIIKNPSPTVSTWIPHLQKATSEGNLSTSVFGIASDAKTSGNYNESNDYLAMVRLRIEDNKQYPPLAKLRQLQGKVVVHFVITLEGTIRSLKIVKSSGSLLLDEAGLRAIRDASPFPRPPEKFFLEEIPIEVPIIFELT